MLNQSVICESPQMQAVLDRAERIARFPSTILLEGETGTGKEVVANWICQHSPRSSFPFIKINCGAIPETLLESELFGYEKGAFTGARNEGNPGLFELADKGTLLLDEVGELSPAMQVKLLRVLNDREVRRVGGSWSRIVDVRVIASTNKNLQSMVEKQLFREDLYYRLNVAYLYIPPLRERREDILPLLNHYLTRICEEYQIMRRFTPEAMTILLNHTYRGNIRELRNFVEGLCVSVETERITHDDVRIHLRINESPSSCTLQAQLDAVEKVAITKAMTVAQSVRQAAKYLGISHSTLLRRLQKYGITSEKL